MEAPPVVTGLTQQLEPPPPTGIGLFDCLCVSVTKFVYVCLCLSTCPCHFLYVCLYLCMFVYVCMSTYIFLSNLIELLLHNQMRSVLVRSAVDFIKIRRLPMGLAAVGMSPSFATLWRRVDRYVACLVLVVLCYLMLLRNYSV